METTKAEDRGREKMIENGHSPGNWRAYGNPNSGFRVCTCHKCLWMIASDERIVKGKVWGGALSQKCDG